MLAGCDLYDEGAVFDRHVHGLALGSADLLRECAGNAQCQAVPPFLEFGSHELASLRLASEEKVDTL